MESVHHFLFVENKRAFVYNFPAATMVDNLFNNPVLFNNVQKMFLIDIMR